MKLESRFWATAVRDIFSVVLLSVMVCSQAASGARSDKPAAAVGAGGDKPAAADTGSNKPATIAVRKIAVDGTFITIKENFAKELDKIKKAGIVVFYPTFVPARFTLKAVKLDDSEKDKRYFDYSIDFCDGKHQCFSVASASYGLGDGPDGNRILNGKSKVFGPFTVDVFNPHAEGNDSDLVYYLSSWLGSKTAGPRHYHINGNGITDKEALAIVESLRRVK